MSAPDSIVTPTLPDGAPSALLAGGPQPMAGLPGRYGVSIGSQRLLLGTDGAVRILEPPDTYRIPNTHPWFLGVANVRGTLVPIYDVAAWLELPAPDSGRMLLVVGDGDAAAGVLIDASPRHLLVDPEAGSVTAQPLADALRAHAGETWQAAGDAWTALDWPALFTELTTRALVAR